jgi:hypothetical protein
MTSSRISARDEIGLHATALNTGTHRGFDEPGERLALSLRSLDFSSKVGPDPNRWDGGRLQLLSEVRWRHARSWTWVSSQIRWQPKSATGAARLHPESVRGRS